MFTHTKAAIKRKLSRKKKNVRRHEGDSSSGSITSLETQRWKDFCDDSGDSATSDMLPYAELFKDFDGDFTIVNCKCEDICTCICKGKCKDFDATPVTPVMEDPQPLPLQSAEEIQTAKEIVEWLDAKDRFDRRAGPSADMKILLRGEGLGISAERWGKICMPKYEDYWGEESWVGDGRYFL